LAGLFCQLHRERFDGLVHVNAADRTASIGFRTGSPVTFLDPTQGHTLGEELVENGLLTRAQYSAVISRVTDGLVDDEAVAFCEHAIQLGYLTEQDADVELSQRIRTRLIQVLSWTDCAMDFEPGDATLEGRREFPQNPGALVYMGVRTFYEEDYVERFFPEPSRMYLRLSAAPATVSHFFGFDDDEFRLLRRLSPEQPLSALLADPNLERAHVLGLIMLLRLGDFCELSKQPFAHGEREISGARPAPQRTERVTAPAPPLNAPPIAARRPSGQMPAASPLTAAARESNQPRVRERPNSDPRSEVSEAGESSSEPRTGQRASAEPRVPAITSRAPQASQVTQPISETSGVATRGRPVLDATQEALLEAAARTAKARKAPATPRKPTTEMIVQQAPEGRMHSPGRAHSGPIGTTTGSIQHANHSALPARHSAGPQTGPIATPQSSLPERGHSGPVQQKPEYAKAHLNELIARRKQTTVEAPQNAKRDVTKDLRQARELLREQHYVRAEELLRALLLQEPDNAAVRAYHLWSRVRAQSQADDKLVEELRDAAKKLVSESEHTAFASYVLGHIYFNAKKDDLAEKFFKRAHAGDRSNKDAERHVLILERRKQLAADAESAANRKLFGIQLSHSKPKP
jgi:hypothetical protein